MKYPDASEWQWARLRRQELLKVSDPHLVWEHWIGLNVREQLNWMWGVVVFGEFLGHSVYCWVSDPHKRFSIKDWPLYVTGD